jgi:hypothetical protein
MFSKQSTSTYAEGMIRKLEYMALEMARMEAQWKQTTQNLIFTGQYQMI